MTAPTAAALVETLGPLIPVEDDPWANPAPALSTWTARYDGFAATAPDGTTYAVTHWGGTYALLVTVPGGELVKVDGGFAPQLKARAAEIAQARYLLV